MSFWVSCRFKLSFVEEPEDVRECVRVRPEAGLWPLGAMATKIQTREGRQTRAEDARGSTKGSTEVCKEEEERKITRRKEYARAGSLSEPLRWHAQGLSGTLSLFVRCTVQALDYNTHGDTSVLDIRRRYCYSKDGEGPVPAGADARRAQRSRTERPLLPGTLQFSLILPPLPHTDPSQK